MRNGLEHCLQNLIRGHHVVKAHERDGVVYPGIMRIYGQDIINAHALQLLQGACAVQRFPVVPAVLTAAVQDRHDNVDAVCLTAGCLNDTLQILIVIVRRHAVFLIEHLILDIIISYIYENEQILATDGGLDQSLAVT